MRDTKIGIHNILTSTTLESNKIHQDSRTIFISIFLYSIVHFSQYSRHIRQRFVEDVSEVYHKTFFQISLLCWRILLKVGYNVNSVPFALHFSSTGAFEQRG